MVLLIFGLTLPGRVTFGAMHGVLPVALLTMNSIRNIPPVYLKAARTLHLSHRQTISTVLFPATLPEIVSGLRIGFTLTLLGVLLAEMFAVEGRPRRADHQRHAVVAEPGDDRGRDCAVPVRGAGQCGLAVDGAPAAPPSVASTDPARDQQASQIDILTYCRARA